jgi:branched-chain amino acid transport system ATP-binding protein
MPTSASRPSMPENGALLEARGITVLRAGAVVVRELDLSVAAGDVVALLGANGAGKSSTADAMTGFARVRGGRITFDGADVTNAAPHKVARRGLLHVTQDRDLFPGMSVRENLLLGHRIAAHEQGPDEAFAEVVRLFPKLEQLAGQAAGSLSGGEQQMAAIARALIGKPKALILDEPSAGLAPIVVAEIGEFLQRLAGSGLTIVLIEQNVDVALQLCSRFVVLRAGRKVFDDDKAALGENPREALAELYMGAAAPERSGHAVG